MNILRQGYYIGFLQAVLPAMLTLVVLPIGFIPPFIRLGLTPDAALIAIYFWGVYRPTSLPASVVLGIGMVADLFASYPLGMVTLSYILALHLLIVRRRLFMLEPLGSFWLGFSIMSCVILPGRWLLSAALIGEWGAFEPLLREWLATLLLYPCLALAFEWIYRLIARGL